MSAWQFKVKLLPSSSLLIHHGKIRDHTEIVRFDKSLSLEELGRLFDELPDYWKGFGHSEALQREISEILPERGSWSSLARMFGENGKDEIELWCEENHQLSRISLSFSLSEPNSEFVHRILDLSDRFNLSLFALQSREVFGPSITAFIIQAEKCSASRYLPSGKRLSDLLA